MIKAIILVIALCVVMFFGITKLVFTAGESACTTWAEETGRETKFIADFPWYSDCLTKSSEDKWISTGRIIN